MTQTKASPTETRTHIEGELSEINVFVRTPDGFDAHVKLAGPYNGGTARKLGELSAALAAAGFAPSSRSGGPARTPGEVDTGPQCPDHGFARIKPSKFKGVYCAARLDDGSYCKWQSEPKVRAVS